MERCNHCERSFDPDAAPWCEITWGYDHPCESDATIGRPMTAERVNVLSYTRQHGGGTFIAATYSDDGTAELANLTDGYAVGVSPKGLTIPQAIAASPAARYIGTWIDDGTLYVDAVIHTHNRRSAIALGRAFDQLAIYDFAAGESIPCQ